MSSTRETLQQLVDRASAHLVTITTSRSGLSRNRVIARVELQVGTQTQSMEDYGETSTSNLYLMQNTTRNLVGKPFNNRNELLLLQTAKLNGDVSVLKRDDDSVTYLVQKAGPAKKESLMMSLTESVADSVTESVTMSRRKAPTCADCGEPLDDHE